MNAGVWRLGVYKTVFKFSFAVNKFNSIQLKFSLTWELLSSVPRSQSNDRWSNGSGKGAWITVATHLQGWHTLKSGVVPEWRDLDELNKGRHLVEGRRTQSPENSCVGPTESCSRRLRGLFLSQCARQPWWGNGYRKKWVNLKRRPVVVIIIDVKKTLAQRIKKNLKNAFLLKKIKKP